MIKRGSLGLSESGRLSPNLKRPAMHCAAFSVTAEPRWNDLSFIFEGISLHALQMGTDAAGFWASEITSPPLGGVFPARQRPLLIFQKGSEHSSSTERAGHWTGPKGSAEPEISKFLSALTELLLSQVSGSSKPGAVIKLTCQVWERKLSF